METKVTTRDLIGDLKNFPFEVVEKMLEYQHKQSGKIDIAVFQSYKCSDKRLGGFSWEDTSEGYDFWNDLIREKNSMYFLNDMRNQRKCIFVEMHIMVKM